MAGLFSRRALVWLCLLAVGLSSLVVATQAEGPPRTNQDRVRALSEDVACPTCDGQSVAESNAVIALEIRRDIQRRVDAGDSDAQVTEALISAYGESIDLRPSSGGLVGLVWTVPVVLMVFGFAALFAVFRRWRSIELEGASDSDVALVEELRRGRAT